MSTVIDEVFEQFQKLLPPEDSVSTAPDAESGSASAGTAGDSETAASAAASEKAEPPPEPEPPCRRIERSRHGYDLELQAPPDRLIDAVSILDRAGFSLDMVSGADWPKDNQLEVLYDFFHWDGPHHITIRTRIPREKPEVPTISAIYPGALWHERETWEFYGIDFVGHPNLIHLILPDDQEGFPLRKDFKATDVDA